MDLISKWFWATCIVVTLVNAAIFRFRAQQQIQKRPELADGYNKIIRGIVIWGNIPWVVMGVGCLYGGAPSFFHFFQPRDGNPFVLAFFASVFLIWALGAYWILFRGGAEMLVRHPGLFNFDFKNTLMVKIFWLLCLVGSIVAVIMMFTMDIPVPLQ